MAAPSTLTDAELKEELLSLGATVGPITATTRSLYQKQLEKRRAAAANPSSSTETKTRTASKSPSRTAKKTVTTSSIEIVKKKVPSDRRMSKTNRSEIEEDAVLPEPQVFVNEKDDDDSTTTNVPASRVTRSSVAVAASHESPLQTLERSLFMDKKLPEIVPEKSGDAKTTRTSRSSVTTFSQDISSKNLSTIYPGLSTPLSLIKPSATSKISQRIPTPPRTTKIPDTFSSSFTPQSSTNPYSASGIFSDITADFASHSLKRPEYSYSSSLNRFRNRIDDDEPDDDEEDDHMESSRYLEPRKQSSSLMSSMSQIPSYAYGAVTAPFKKASPYGKYQTEQRKLNNFMRRNGSDVANCLLYTMGCMFVFLLFGYVGIVHSEKVIDAGIAAVDFAKVSVALVYTYAVLPTFIVAIVCGIGMALYILNQRLLSAKAERRKRVFDLVEKITEIIRESTAEGQEYVAEPHVRDMLLAPSQRTKGSAEWRRWQEAVNFINQNDSRVSTESRIINGVECAVWRWVPANKIGWQGSAFDGRTQLNVPEHALSHCLKLRGMASLPKGRDGAEVERAVLQKLSPIRPLHIHAESGSKDGVVFIRFANLPDCKAAFTALHGTWFNGQLVSAKYLRDERYEQRFPGTAHGTARL